MSKMFSVVTLASDSGLLEEYYAPGSPDCAEDLLEDEIIRDDLRSLPKSDRVYAEIGTYLYGEGETERASEEVNCTPFVRQYDILSNKWGVLLCQKEYRTNDIRRNSRSWSWKL